MDAKLRFIKYAPAPAPDPQLPSPLIFSRARPLIENPAGSPIETLSLSHANFNDTVGAFASRNIRELKNLTLKLRLKSMLM